MDLDTFRRFRSSIAGFFLVRLNCFIPLERLLQLRPDLLHQDPRTKHFQFRPETKQLAFQLKELRLSGTLLRQHNPVQ